MQEKRRKFTIFLGAILLAGAIVIGSLLWLTGAFSNNEATPDEFNQARIETIPTPEPTPIARISPEAAMTDMPHIATNVQGVATTAQTGPVENILILATIVALLGLGGGLYTTLKLA